MLISLLIVKWHPRVRHIIHQVVPVPRGHHGLQLHSKHRLTNKHTNVDCVRNATIPCAWTERLQVWVRRGNAVHCCCSVLNRDRFERLFPCVTKTLQDFLPDTLHIKTQQRTRCPQGKSSVKKRRFSPQVISFACSLWVCVFESRPADGNPAPVSLPPQCTKQVLHWSKVPRHDATRSWEEIQQTVSPPLRRRKLDRLHVFLGTHGGLSEGKKENETEISTIWATVVYSISVAAHVKKVVVFNLYTNWKLKKRGSICLTKWATPCGSSTSNPLPKLKYML